MKRYQVRATNMRHREARLRLPFGVQDINTGNSQTLAVAENVDPRFYAKFIAIKFDWTSMMAINKSILCLSTLKL